MNDTEFLNKIIGDIQKRFNFTSQEMRNKFKELIDFRDDIEYEELKDEIALETRKEFREEFI